MFPHVTDVFVMYRTVKRMVTDFVIFGVKKRWIILRELRQYSLEFFMMQKTKIALINIVKDVQRERKKLCTNF